MADQPGDRPYEVRESPTFIEDCRLIHPERQTFNRLFSSVRFILERAPYVRAKSMDGEGRLWVRRFDAHKTTNGLDVPVLVVSYEIESQPPPRGVILLRHVRTADDIEAGLHVGGEPF
jgi:hypothetical protein